MLSLRANSRACSASCSPWPSSRVVRTGELTARWTRARPDALGGGVEPVEQVSRDVQVPRQVLRGSRQQHQETRSPGDDRGGTDDLEADVLHRGVKARLGDLDLIPPAAGGERAQRRVE